MDNAANLLHFALLPLLLSGILPTYLIVKHRRHGSNDPGFPWLVAGSMLLCLYALLHYLHETGIVPHAHALPAGITIQNDDVAITVAVLASLGFLRGFVVWLPAVQSLSEEIAYRQMVEDELQALTMELSDTAVRAEEAMQSKAEFLAAMSHEVRTPLNAVIGYAQMLQQGYFGKIEGDKNREYVGLIIEGATQLLGTLTDILELSKLESGRFEPRNEEVDMVKLVEGSVTFLHPMLNESEHYMSLQLEEGTLWTDPRLLRLILIHLVSNAAKFTPRGGRLLLEGHPTNDGYLIRITDTGIGMTSEEMARALEPFTQLQMQYARGYKGAGLGLPLVQRYARILGAEFTLQSRKGVGTVAQIEVPVSKQSQQAA
ncbi:sensor histidine kinase [Pseudokordiimonas caeni]|uniref:sensor histidine kinase n=1 Tax=Pseudokordiimonas caeni TaxID=2997908 RepID=UPI002810E361|nr:HAMP domain-containing sensor histidine kinase [Pseudokordiimonas caeni]